MTLTHVAAPLSLASCKAVSPFHFCSGSAPARNRRRAILAWPIITANTSAPPPCLLVRLTDAPRCSSESTTCWRPACAEIISSVKPPAARASRHPPASSHAITAFFSPRSAATAMASGIAARSAAAAASPAASAAAADAAAAAAWPSDHACSSADTRLSSAIAVASASALAGAASGVARARAMCDLKTPTTRVWPARFASCGAVMPSALRSAKVAPAASSWPTMPAQSWLLAASIRAVHPLWSWRSTIAPRRSNTATRRAWPVLAATISSDIPLARGASTAMPLPPRSLSTVAQSPVYAAWNKRSFSRTA